MAEKTCYISVFYLGDRRINQKEVDENFGYSLTSKDKFEHLHKQIAYLLKVEHNLNKIFFVFNLDSDHYPYIKDINKIVAKQIKNTPVKIKDLVMELGMMYLNKIEIILIISYLMKMIMYLLKITLINI